ncbi:MAG: class II glutamine amidotransferase [Bacillota bacterium]
MLGIRPRIPSGCAISGIMSRKGRRMNGEAIIQSIALMHDRSNGLGGGFAAYGIYPQYKDHYAFHMMYHSETAKINTEMYIREYFFIDGSEPLPTRPLPQIGESPILWRYFLRVRPEALNINGFLKDERDFVVDVVMYINNQIDGAFVASSGKNMGAFKGVGYPEDIGRFYRLEEYEAYLWTAHGRFPTNTPGWWGGAHPFCLLDWSVVHNGEITSYGINKRYLEMFGYKCNLQTDTEVVTYIFDLMVRRQKLPFAIAAKAVAPEFWHKIDRLPADEKELFTAIRQVYGSALLNGPFSIILGHSRGMLGLSDRIKLRPMVAAEKDDLFFLASEESAIREICPAPDRVWAPRGGEPVLVELEEGVEV